MKKNLTIISATFIMAGLLIWSTGCKKDENTSNEFLIHIDSIVHPDTIQVTDKLTVKFYGEVGTNGCYSFNRFEKVDLSNDDPTIAIKFKVWGKYEDTGNCTQQIVYLDGAEVGINGFTKGAFSILVIQPDGSIMTGLVYVKE
ncbi:MAG: hypothetical protein L3J66_05650 [Bacteroidales bacterium]|nr:hypothetical protein [Bacteroidales bacterium]